MIFACHAGDSRILMWTHEDKLYESIDHIPTRFDEFERIVNAGGFVVNGRLNGSIAVSRSFGDFELEPAITCSPYILSMYLKDSTKIRILLTSDAFHDNPTTQATDYAAMVKSIKSSIGANVPNGGISRALVEFTSNYTTDDTTALYYEYRRAMEPMSVTIERANGSLVQLTPLVKTKSLEMVKKKENAKPTKSGKITKSDGDSPTNILTVTPSLPSLHIHPMRSLKHRLLH